MLGEGAPFEHLPLPAGYPCEELQVLKCLEKGQRDRFLEEFSFLGGPLRNFACTCSHFVVSTNAPHSALLGTGACSPLTSQVAMLRVFCVPLLTPTVLWLWWIFGHLWFEAELLRTLCVYRNSRSENERLRGSKSFLKVWEYRPEKGREIFLKLYQCFTRTRIAHRAY